MNETVGQTYRGSNIVAWVCAIALLTPIAGANAWATPIEAVRIDGAKSVGTFIGFSPDALLLEVDGNRADVVLSELRTLRFGHETATPIAPAGATIFHFAAGGRMRGTMTGQAGEAVVAKSALGDDLKIPLQALAGVWFDRADADLRGRELFDEAMSQRMAGKDVLVTLADGQVSTVRGSVVALGPDGGRIVLGREEKPFSLERVMGIVFAKGLSGDERWPVIVVLADGSEVSARLQESDASTMRLNTSFGSEQAIDVGLVASMRFSSERVTMLTDLAPTRNETTGVLLEPMPARFDRSVALGALMIDGRTYENGAGVHADNLLEYESGGAYIALCATIGIDDSVRPRGSVVFRVMGDGKPLFDSGPVTGRDSARDIRVDVSGVSKLVLSVTHGDDLDLSDRANWADARLIKPAGNSSAP